MQPIYGIILIALYFSILIAVSWFTARGETNTQTFFIANKQSAWYLVAFGMIGTSLSGVTFISVPGMVKVNHFHYLQMVFGYLVGYFFIASVLMPLYYRLNLISIYTYLEKRFGYWSYKTGAAFFLLSRLVGSSARFFLVLSVLHLAIFEAFHIPFWATVGIGLLLIWVYTQKGGIKTIIITDTLQTTCMLMALVATIWYIASHFQLQGPIDLFSYVAQNPDSKIWSSAILDRSFWLKQFLGGAFIAITMTGLDQDMMQKNLTCRSLKDAQKNMFWFSILLVIVNILFLSLGLLLFAYAEKEGIDLPQKSDQLFPLLALNHFPVWLGLLFLMGIIAATYASTDSALAALTTSFCFDFLNFSNKAEAVRQRWKTRVHIAMSALIWIVVLMFYKFNDESLIVTVFELAGLTYGPLLGLYAFGLTTQRKPVDTLVPIISILSPLLAYWLKNQSPHFFYGYQIGVELVLINGIIAFMLLWASSFFAGSKKEPQFQS